jgi:hypothetical protein
MSYAERNISKQKGVELCGNLLYVGKATKEIVREITETYGVSRSAVEKWMKAARPAVEARQRDDNLIHDRELAAGALESAKRLNISRDRVLEEYAKIAFSDIRAVLTVDGGLKPVSEWDDNSAASIGGIESFDEKCRDTGEVLGTVRKIKVLDKRAALDSICNVMGYNASKKVEETITFAKPVIIESLWNKQPTVVYQQNNLILPQPE